MPPPLNIVVARGREAILHKKTKEKSRQTSPRRRVPPTTTPQRLPPVAGSSDLSRHTIPSILVEKYSVGGSLPIAATPPNTPASPPLSASSAPAQPAAAAASDSSSDRSSSAPGRLAQTQSQLVPAASSTCPMCNQLLLQQSQSDQPHREPSPLPNYGPPPNTAESAYGQSVPTRSHPRSTHSRPGPPQSQPAPAQSQPGPKPNFPGSDPGLSGPSPFYPYRTPIQSSPDTESRRYKGSSSRISVSDLPNMHSFSNITEISTRILGKRTYYMHPWPEPHPESLFPPLVQAKLPTALPKLNLSEQSTRAPKFPITKMAIAMMRENERKQAGITGIEEEEEDVRSDRATCGSEDFTYQSGAE